MQGNWTSQSWRKSVLNIHWKDWCWSWNSNSLATWCEELTHWKRPWCWERLKAGGEGDNGGWDGWRASLTQWAWVWVNLESWWWTGKPGVLQSMGSQRVGHSWATELNWIFHCLNRPFICRGHSGCFHFLISVKNAVMNRRVHWSIHAPASESSGCWPGGGLTDPMIFPSLNFWGPTLPWHPSLVFLPGRFHG